MMKFKLLLEFLKTLNKNNNREWFEKNRKDFENLKLEFIGFTDEIIKDLSKYDPDISDIEAKKTIFRINRDVRFSLDKSPYKNNMGASIKKEGKKSPYAGYYIHIQPGKSFLGGGLYLPNPELLQKVREEIDYNETQLRSILQDKKFVSFFGPMQGEQLKNPPKGFDKDHSALDLLKFKSFLMIHPLDDKQLIDASIKGHTNKIFKAMIPLNSFLNKAISYQE